MTYTYSVTIITGDDEGGHADKLLDLEEAIGNCFDDEGTEVRVRLTSESSDG